MYMIRRLIFFSVISGIQQKGKKFLPVNLIISNPPYIPQFQKQFLDKHVKDFEPGVALVCS